MSNAGERLERRAQQMATDGGDPLRVQAMKLAGHFKRSWLEMGEVLKLVQRQRSFEKWSYGDLYAYCAEELFIKRATVDKLIVSFTTLERHAPEVLERDGVSQPIPSYDTVAYFGRVLEEQRIPDDDPDALTQLRQAVFEETKPMAAIRKEFNPVFFSKSEEEQELDSLERASSSARRLAQLIPSVPGLPSDRVKVLCAELAAFQDELEALLPKARERAAQPERPERKAS